MNPVRLAVLALSLAFLAGAGVAAQEAPKIEVNSLKFEGVEHVDAAQLRGALATRVSSRWPWGKDALFDRSKFEADLERIRAFYVDRGFPDARVTSFDVKLNEKNTEVDLTITVEEGKPLLVTGVEIWGLREDIPGNRLAALKREGPLKVGQPLDRAALATMREGVANELRDRGYPFVRVNADLLRDVDPHAVTVVFNALTGPKAYFGPTEIAGTRDVDDYLIRRELLYKEGDLYRRSVTQETQRKLYDLELFQFVSLRPYRGERPSPGTPGALGPPGEPSSPSDDGQLPAPLDPSATRPRLGPDALTSNQAGPTPTFGQEAPDGTRRVPMRVTVTESRHRRVLFSAGYGTEERARVEGQFRQLNFLGGARTAALRGKWSSLDRGLRLEFNNPYLFHPRWSLQVNGERWYDNQPAFTAVTSGGHAILTFKPGPRNSLSLTVTNVYQSSEISNAALEDLDVRDELIALGLDPTTGGQSGTLVGISFDARRSTTTNPLNATRGYSASLHLERAGRLIYGSYAYTNGSFELRHYQPFGRRLVVATRGQIGLLRPDGGVIANVPFAKRYFLGGATSVRGWGRYELSPLSGSGLPIGGFSMLEGTVEGRYSITSKLGAVAFVDLGNVWTEAWDINLNDLRYAVGPGLRYNTPVGPLRVDLGFQVNPIERLLVKGEPQKRRWRVHFSIGQAF